MVKVREQKILNKYLVRFNVRYKRASSKYGSDYVIKKKDIFYAKDLDHLTTKIKKTYCFGVVASSSELEILECIPLSHKRVTYVAN